MRQALILAVIFLFGGGTASAQSVETDVTPESASLVRQDHDFALSSIVSDETLEAAKFEDEHDRFAVKVPQRLMARLDDFDQYFELMPGTKAVIAAPSVP